MSDRWHAVPGPTCVTVHDHLVTRVAQRLPSVRQVGVEQNCEGPAVRAHANLTDEDILQRLRHGDIDALATFYDRHHHPALCLASSLGCDLVQAEQAVAEAFLLLWRNAARYRREDESTPRAWLLGMVAYRSRRLIGEQAQRVASRAIAG